MDRLEEKILIIALTVLAGCAGIIGSMILPQFELQMFCYSSGISFLVLSIIFSVMVVRSFDKKASQPRQNKGAIWVWAVCLLALVVLAMGWFTLTWPTFIIIETIEAQFSFPPEATNAINLMKNVLGWFLILMALGLLGWAFVNSQRREEITYPYP